MTFDVMLVLLSFIMAWGEVWFLDFRVLPLEEKAKEIQGQWTGGGGGDTERTPLLVGARSAMLFRYMEAGAGAGAMGAGSINTGVESLANFYSPLESPEDSGDELEEDTMVAIPSRFKRKTPLNEKAKNNALRYGENNVPYSFVINCRSRNIVNWVKSALRPRGAFSTPPTGG